MSESIHFGTRACKSVESQVSQDLGASTASHPPSPTAGRGPLGGPSPAAEGEGFWRGLARGESSETGCDLGLLVAGLAPGQTSSPATGHRETLSDCKQRQAWVCAKLLQSCPTLCNAMDWSPPGSSVRGILQARTLVWVAMPFSRGPSGPGDGTRVSCTAG